MKKIIILLLLCVHCAYGEEPEKLVILGGGPAGLTCALFAAQAHLDPIVVEGDPYAGQIGAIYRIENYPGFPEGIRGSELASKIHQQAEKFGARFNASHAVHVDLAQSPFRVVLQDGQEIFCKALVIATGASPKWLGIENEAELIGRGVSASATLDAEKFQNKNVVVIGGGDSAMEQALLLTEYAAHVTIIYKGDSLYGAKYLQERVLHHDKISCKFQSDVMQILGENQVSGLILENVKTHQQTFLACDGIFVSNGRKPNTDLFLDQLEINDKGYIVTKSDSTLTNIPGVFAAGDITHAAYRKVTTSVGAGCMAAIDATKYLSSKKGA